MSHHAQTMACLPELVDCVLAASDIYTPEGVVIFMRSANDCLDGRKPVDLIYDGQGKRVLALLHASGDGVFV